LQRTGILHYIDELLIDPLAYTILANTIPGGVPSPLIS
jgi:hypothetical protein